MKSASPLVYLGIGAAIATGALFLMSQAVPPTSHSSSSAIPRKNVVNIFESFGTGLPAGQKLVLYTVPSDRWLTVTHAACETNDTQQWVEVYNGVTTIKGHVTSLSSQGIYHPHSEVGWVFRPGSQLAIKNPTATSYSVGRATLVGYLSRD